ncbi:uncharacterized protein MELLADRAFT_90677 [Melampsora larici-populina 98AG31]|uniref:ubiquitinyl hydrolase 1 n=1 Tax=Melampsora larici-populina (strain 98AG31 / pathotype 3-4-7) TaxID=747676 RepID=F4RXR8_MELLP|nr:uncharacterized protein MELLADRAFT_90677 [Melampsora larici-populina 98AG31]EGG02850.1 hypothetical protein MELLADRAFT_90677 [Melampsora larici-populina 98AG31]
MTTLVIVLSILLGRIDGWYLRLMDRLQGLCEVVKSLDGVRGIDFNRIAASFRGEEVGIDEHLNVEVNRRSIKRSIKESRLKSTQVNDDMLNHSSNCTIKPELHYPGLINSSTNTCFLNAVLQSLASMPHLTSYLDMIHSYQETKAQEPQTPVINSLRELLGLLNTPRDFQSVLRPVCVAQALFKHTNHHSLFNSEQQDAQEFLIIMIDAIESEVQSLMASIRLESFRFSCEKDQQDIRNQIRFVGRSPFRALMVNRIACETCGLTSVFRHSVADHFSLNVPPKLTCSLEECLMEYTKLELLEDYICMKCSLLKTKETIWKRIEECKEKPNNNNQKKRLQAIKKDYKLIESMVLDHDYESEGNEKHRKGLVERIASLTTTKQTMFARPPQSLTFHLSRSTAYTRGVSFKNHCQVKYPEYLNLNRFCSTSKLNKLAHLPISSCKVSSKDQEEIQVWYRLASVVVHYGSHSFGHYITFRRIGKDSWLRVSDESVLKSDLGEVLKANPFLIMYERLCEKDLMRMNGRDEDEKLNEGWEMEMEGNGESEGRERERDGVDDDDHDHERNSLKCRKLHWFEI